jgi:hypothetical protein
MGRDHFYHADDNRTLMFISEKAPLGLDKGCARTLLFHSIGLDFSSASRKLPMVPVLPFSLC